jgi:hypothetical protein
MFFQDIQIVKSPSSRHKVIFQCDKKYFNDYAFYNLLSCNDVGHDVHIHFINIDELYLQKVLDLDLKIDLSISIENVDTNINYYKLKSYYFTSRYFITDYLFEQNLIDHAYITDADIIFNEHISVLDYDLGVLYYPGYEDNLWKQTGANFLSISKNKKKFLEKIIAEYRKKLPTINFESIHEDMPKYERANMYALDQVCMSIAMKTEDVTSEKFLNLTQIDRFIRNKDMTYKIWSLTARKNPATIEILKNRFKRSF